MDLITGPETAYVCVNYDRQNSDTAEASWRRMYLRDALGEVTELLYYSFEGGSNGRMEWSGALTLGEIVEKGLGVVRKEEAVAGVQ